MVIRAERAKAEPIGLETWERYLSKVRIFADGLIARGELAQDFNEAVDAWIGSRRPHPPGEAILDASYSYEQRADGSLHIHADTEEDHLRVMELHDRMGRPTASAPTAKAARTLGEARDLFPVQFNEKNPAPHLA